MFYLGAGPGKLEPEVAADHEDDRVDEHQVGEILGVPVQRLLVAHLVDEAVLLQVQVCLQPRHLLVGQQGHILRLRPVGQRCRLVGGRGPLRQADDLILHDLGDERPDKGGGGGETTHRTGVRRRTWRKNEGFNERRKERKSEQEIA